MSSDIVQRLGYLPVTQGTRVRLPVLEILFEKPNYGSRQTRFKKFAWKRHNTTTLWPSGLRRVTRNHMGIARGSSNLSGVESFLSTHTQLFWTKQNVLVNAKIKPLQDKKGYFHPRRTRLLLSLLVSRWVPLLLPQHFRFVESSDAWHFLIFAASSLAFPLPPPPFIFRLLLILLLWHQSFLTMSLQLLHLSHSLLLQLPESSSHLLNSLHNLINKSFHHLEIWGPSMESSERTSDLLIIHIQRHRVSRSHRQGSRNGSPELSRQPSTSLP